MSAHTHTPTEQLITPGLQVYTLDNRRLGRVKEVQGRYFKLDVRFRRDYWLDRRQVAYADKNCVGMLFRSGDAELYKMSSPQDTGVPRAFQRQPGPGDIDRTDLRGRFPLP